MLLLNTLPLEHLVFIFTKCVWWCAKRFLAWHSSIDWRMKMDSWLATGGIQREEADGELSETSDLSPIAQKRKSEVLLPSVQTWMSDRCHWNKKCSERASFGLCIVKWSSVGRKHFWDFQVGPELKMLWNHSSVKCQKKKKICKHLTLCTACTDLFSSLCQIPAQMSYTFEFNGILCTSFMCIRKRDHKRHTLRWLSHRNRGICHVLHFCKHLYITEISMTSKVQVQRGKCITLLKWFVITG